MKGSRINDIDNRNYIKSVITLIRNEIKVAKKSGEIDKDFRISVKESRGGLSYSIIININAVPTDIDADKLKSVRLKLREITDLFNYDNSDIMTDYFDVGFYVNISNEFMYK